MLKRNTRKVLPGNKCRTSEREVSEKAEETFVGLSLRSRLSPFFRVGRAFHGGTRYTHWSRSMLHQNCSAFRSISICMHGCSSALFSFFCCVCGNHNDTKTPDISLIRFETGIRTKRALCIARNVGRTLCPCVATKQKGLDVKMGSADAMRPGLQVQKGF